MKKVLIVHNNYGRYSGEEAVVDKMAEMLTRLGFDVAFYRRTTEGARESFAGKAAGFLSGLWSPAGVRGMREALRREKPDVVNVHNLYPFISPAALFECRKAGVPVVMTVHNFRLICPTGLFMRDGRPCELCLERGDEWGCVRRNCEHSFLKSLGYAARNAVARRTGAYRDCVDRFACITDFQRRKLIAAGYPPERITVIPNSIDVPKDCNTALQTLGQTVSDGCSTRLATKPTPEQPWGSEDSTKDCNTTMQTLGQTIPEGCSTRLATKPTPEQPWGSEDSTKDCNTTMQTLGQTVSEGCSTRLAPKPTPEQPDGCEDSAQAHNEVMRPSETVCNYVAYLGRLSPEKGYDLLIEAARRHPEIEFRFAGAVRGNIPDPLPGNVRLMGQLGGEVLTDFIRGCSFLVMPSRCYEGFPVAILEAAAQHKPAIGPDHGGFTEIIGKGDDAIGRLFTPGDLGSLEERLTELWNSPETVRTLGDRAYRKLTERYSTEVVGERWKRLLDELAAGGHGENGCPGETAGREKTAGDKAWMNKTGK